MLPDKNLFFKAMMRSLQFFLATILLVSFTGCESSSKPLSDASPSATAEQTTIVEQGVITPKEITIFENGTHYLTTTAGKKYLLKSSIIDLSRFENEQVAVTGETDNKQGGDDPVITVFGVDRIGQAPETRQSILTETELGFSVQLPGNWQRSMDETATPTVVTYHPENEDPIIKVESLSINSPAGIAAQQEMTSGIPVTITGKQGWRLLVPGGGIDIFVPLRDTRQIVVFHFVPGKNPEMERAVFYEMLTGLEWIDPQSASSSPTATTSPGTTAYCGGIAKKLCPSGFRCELLTLEENATGVCVDSSLPPSDISASLSGSTTPSPSKSPSTSSPSPSTSPLTTLPSGWKSYTNERFQYSFSVPVAWWWRQVNVTGNTPISRLDIALEEVTNENSIAKIEIFPGNRTKMTEAVALGIITISAPRDDTTYFEVSGNADYASQIRTIAQSLSSF